MPAHERGWALSASSFNWTRDILRAEDDPFDILARDAADVCDLMEVELGQCFRSFPDMDDREVAVLRSRLDTAGVDVSIVGLSLDELSSRETQRSSGERLAFLEPQLRAAARLGAHGVRLPFGQPGGELLSAVLPLLHELELTFYQEIQGTQGPGQPEFQQTMSELSDLSDPHFAVLLDASMVTHELPTTYLERLRSSGVPGSLVDRVTREWGEPETARAVRECLAAGLVPLAALPLFMTMVVRFGSWSVADLSPVLPWVKAVHLKFWDLDDTNGRVTAPLGDLITELFNSGFAGTLCSEWGGHDWYLGPESATEMTRSHLALVRGVVDEVVNRPGHPLEGGVDDES